MDYVIMLLRWALQFLAELCGLIFLLAILCLILLVCKVYDLIRIINKYTKKYMYKLEIAEEVLDGDETDEVEEDEEDEDEE